MSVAGGVENAYYAAAEVGCDCVQIFVKNQRQWEAPPLEESTVEAFGAARAETGIDYCVAHASYLLNLASPEDDKRQRSIDALVDEIERCFRLSVPHIVLHPGAHKGAGEEAGIELIARSLDRVFAKTESYSTLVLLETMAGQGTTIGADVAHLGRIIEACDHGTRLGVCVDTCHVFAAGCDIRKEQEYEALVTSIGEQVGIENVKCFHLNDSMRECGSRVDRHTHIGKGEIGNAGFRHLLNDKRFVDVPKILETPKGVDDRGTDLDRENLRRLRSLIATKSARK